MAMVRITATFDDGGDYDGLMEALNSAGLVTIESEEDGDADDDE